MVLNSSIFHWHNNLTDAEIKKLRTHQTIKTSFRLQPYLFLVGVAPFRTTVARIRASSHTLAVEDVATTLDRKH